MLVKRIRHLSVEDAEDVLHFPRRDRLSFGVVDKHMSPVNASLTLPHLLLHDFEPP